MEKTEESPSLTGRQTNLHSDWTEARDQAETPLPQPPPQEVQDVEQALVSSLRINYWFRTDHCQENDYTEESAFIALVYNYSEPILKTQLSRIY